MNEEQAIGRSKRLILCPWEESPEAVRDCLRLYSDPRVMAQVGKPMADLQEAAASLARGREHMHKHGFALWAVWRRKDQVLLGSCGLLANPEGYPEAAFHIFPESWGRGYATEALGLVVRHAFGPLRLQGLAALVEPGNNASVSVLEKCGFRLRGDMVEEGEPLLEYVLEKASG